MVRTKIMTCMFLAAVLAGGCWDVEEIDDRSIIAGLGLDAAPNNHVKVSAEIPNVRSLMAPTAVGQQGEKTNLSYVVSAVSDLTFDAVPRLQAKTDMSIFFGQTKVVVIGMDLARRGISYYTELIERHPKIPPQATVVLSAGEAADILRAEPPEAERPTAALVDYFNAKGKVGVSFRVRSRELLHWLDTSRTEPEEAFLPIVRIDADEKCFIIEELGVFHGDRLVGTLNAQETRDFGLLTGRARNAYFELVLPEGGRSAWRGLRATRKTVVSFRDGRIIFDLRLKIKGFLNEVAGVYPSLDRSEMRMIQHAAARDLTRSLTRTVSRLQEMNADVLGLGELLRAKHPDIWERTDWNRDFPLTEIRIAVDFVAERTGITR